MKKPIIDIIQGDTEVFTSQFDLDSFYHNNKSFGDSGAVFECGGLKLSISRERGALFIRVKSDEPDAVWLPLTAVSKSAEKLAQKGLSEAQLFQAVGKLVLSEREKIIKKINDLGFVREFADVDRINNQAANE